MDERDMQRPQRVEQAMDKLLSAFIDCTLHAQEALELRRYIIQLEQAARRTTPDREAIIAAAWKVVREELDDVLVHPCDMHDDDVKADRLAEPMRALYLVLKTAPTSDKGGA